MKLRARIIWNVLRGRPVAYGLTMKFGSGMLNFDAPENEGGIVACCTFINADRLPVPPDFDALKAENERRHAEVTGLIDRIPAPTPTQAKGGR